MFSYHNKPRITHSYKAPYTMNAIQQSAYIEAVRRIDSWITRGNPYQPLDFSNMKHLNMLPPIPYSARILNISHTDVDELDELPLHLEELYCANSKLRQLPPLPNTLRTLSARGCPFEMKPTTFPLTIIQCLID